MADLTENNRKHFDKVASSHQHDFGELINMVIAELESRRGWISPQLAKRNPNTAHAAGDEFRLLDYACGAGTVSKVSLFTLLHPSSTTLSNEREFQALAPYTTRTIGLDLSANMVSEYNKAAREIFGVHNSGPARMEGFQHDLLGTSPSDQGSGADADDNKLLPSGTLAPFDIIVIGMALHHVADAGELMQRFAKLLKSGGVCIVVDMVSSSARLDDGEGDESSDLRERREPGENGTMFDTIAKHGFTAAEMKDLYEEAGMRKFDYQVFEHRFCFRLFGQQCSSLGFIARGERT
ncbi:hypothetical protein F1880_008344 [Penicillium rolfsii]|nr:hypothetical protein F1880_008344 [Penicillium rolfsii]